MQLYADSSALLRVLLNERGVKAPLSSRTVVVSSELAEVECFRALDQARLQGQLTDLELARKSRELFALLKQVHLFPVSSEVIQLARASFPVAIRTLDALHVATALVVTDEAGPLDFWTHLPRQAAAAMVRGLPVRGVSAES